jgi:uncharacterized coiled-coil DUF342 family protein
MTNNDLLAEAGKQIANIKDFMAEAHDVKNQFQEIQQKINEIITESDRIREHMNSSIRELKAGIQSSQNISMIVELRQRISSLESKMNSLKSVSVSSGGSSSSGSKQEMLDKLHELLNEIRSNISGMNSSDVFNKIVDFYKNS